MLWLAYFLSVVNAVIIGLSFLFVKVAVTHASAIDTLAFRFLVALTFCVVYMRLAKIPLRIDFKRLLPLLLMAVFFPIGFFTFQAYGILHICITSTNHVFIFRSLFPIVISV